MIEINGTVGEGETCEHHLAEARTRIDELNEMLANAEAAAVENHEALWLARETITRLNRRAQLAEAGVREREKNGPAGMGRGLANAAASLHRGRAAALEQTLRDLRSYLAHSGQDASSDFMAELIGRALNERHVLDDYDPLTVEQLTRLRDGEPPSSIGFEESEAIKRLVSMVDRSGMVERLHLYETRRGVSLSDKELTT